MTNACIYVVCCKDSNITDIYVGSTRDMFSRKIWYIQEVKKSNRKVYKFIRDHGGFKNWKMIVVEYLPIDIGIRNLLIKETLWYDRLKPTLNQNRPLKLTDYEMKFEEVPKYFMIYVDNNKICSTYDIDYPGKVVLGCYHNIDVKGFGILLPRIKFYWHMKLIKTNKIEIGSIKRDLKKFSVDEILRQYTFFSKHYLLNPTAFGENWAANSISMRESN